MKGDETSKKHELSSFVVGADENDNKRVGKRVCEACSGQHRIWRCERFKALELNERQKVVRQKGLCNKCLERGHIAKKCPKTNFKCRASECGAQHHTLLHRPRSVNMKQSEETQEEKIPFKQDNGAGNHRESKDGQHDGSVAATRTGEKRVCLGVVPVRVRGNGNTKEVETYALLDNGSEVTLCHERLMNALDMAGEKLSFTLTGINGSTEVESQLIDIVVESLDGTTTVELPNVKTVKSMSVSKDCIPRQTDLERWQHLQDIKIPEIKGDVLLLIGLKENPRLFIPLKVREGGENAPIAIRYSLGWTVLGPVRGAKETRDSVVNFARTKNEVIADFERTNGRSIKEHPSDSVEELEKMENSDHTIERVGCMYSDDTARAADDLLSHQLKRLWNTDFIDPETNTEFSLSVEDKRAVEIMEQSLKIKDGHFQLALPWRQESFNIPNNKPVAEKRLDYLKRTN